MAEEPSQADESRVAGEGSADQPDPEPATPSASPGAEGEGGNEGGAGESPILDADDLAAVAVPATTPPPRVETTASFDPYPEADPAQAARAAGTEAAAQGTAAREEAAAAAAAAARESGGGSASGAGGATESATLDADDIERLEVPPDRAAAPPVETTQPYDPNPSREFMRGMIAILLLTLLSLVVVAAFLSIWFKVPEEPELLDDLMKLVFAPIVGLVGAVTGFYYGTQPQAYSDVTTAARGTGGESRQQP